MVNTKKARSEYNELTGLGRRVQSPDGHLTQKTRFEILSASVLFTTLLWVATLFYLTVMVARSTY